ncbi:protein of unknown function [Devosia crocina]|uniref:DUF4214 domain-containing protein n=1 Tax=Devosia crocina TaxID=429728 RepID=A0A1I7NDF2_9HYPH|nr:DUF4214 domain-containing protein [Devosia crocina]SFV32583.1 protein of unknown function [Devosia crocina]
MDTEISVEIARLYVSFFHRAPDPEGLQYWMDRYEEEVAKGQDADLFLESIADSFAQSPEAKAIYETVANPTQAQLEDYVSEAYNNLFGREPDAEGLAYWTGRWQTEVEAGRPGVRVLFEIENAARGSSNANDVAALQNKAEVAAKFTTDFIASKATWTQADMDRAGTLLEGVDHTPASVVKVNEENAKYIEERTPVAPEEPGPVTPGPGPQPEPDATKVTTEAELLAALEDKTIETITVAGDITLTETLVINRAVTILGEELPQIDRKGVAYHEITLADRDVGIQVYSNGVTLQNLYYDASAVNKYGIKVEPIHGSTERLSDFSLNGGSISGSGSSNVDLNSVTKSAITNFGSTFSGGNGITLTDSTEVSLTNVSVYSNAWGGVALYSKGGYFPFDGGTSGITISGNIHDVPAVYAQEHNSTSVEGIRLDLFGNSSVYGVSIGDKTMFFPSEGLASQYAAAQVEGKADMEAIVSLLSPNQAGYSADTGKIIGAHISGTDGSDTIEGTLGNDFISAGAGNDIIDLTAPMSGSDTVYFDTADGGHDTIIGFRAAGEVFHPQDDILVLEGAADLLSVAFVYDEIHAEEDGFDFDQNTVDVVLNFVAGGSVTFKDFIGQKTNTGPWFNNETSYHFEVIGDGAIGTYTGPNLIEDVKALFGDSLVYSWEYQ